MLLTLADLRAAVFLVLKKPLDMRVSSSVLPLWRAGKWRCYKMRYEIVIEISK